MKEREKRYRDSEKGRVTQLLKTARKRAKKTNRKFDISREWLTQKIRDGVCEVTGGKFSYYKKENYKSAPFVPSLDRIDSTKGYTQDNIQVVIYSYNLLKWQWDKQDLRKIIEILKSIKV